MGGRGPIFTPWCERDLSGACVMVSSVYPGIVWWPEASLILLVIPEVGSVWFDIVSDLVNLTGPLSGNL